mmetsp:Transcript_14580/g.40513  ORF Transcript_14580/g.40513 Transcript_14580/m.40513 type:complete len:428 (-) Transcript_14580:1709-2992(-)
MTAEPFSVGPDRIHSMIIQLCLTFSSVLFLVAPINSVQGFSTTTPTRALIIGTNQIKKSNGPVALHESVGESFVDNIDRDDASSSVTTTPLDWSFLDSVCLIHCPNGDVEGSRIKSTRNILDDINLLDATTIKEFETDDEDRVRGCYTSHVSVFKDLLGKSSATAVGGFDFFNVFRKTNDDRSDNTDGIDEDLNVLIFEDNLFLGNRILTQETIDAVSNFIQDKTNQWDVIHLAYIPYVPDLQVSRTNDKRIVKLSTSNKQSALGTTAYIISKRAMKRIVEEDNKNGYTVSIPDAMADLFGDSRYALNPTAFVRAPATKSLVNPQLDDLRTILFRPTVVSIVQQILVLTGLSTTALLPLVVVLLLLTSISSAISSVNAAVEFVTYRTIDGPLFFPVANALFSLFSLGIILQGILLAPKPETGDDDDM